MNTHQRATSYVHKVWDPLLWPNGRYVFRTLAYCDMR